MPKQTTPVETLKIIRKSKKGVFETVISSSTKPKELLSQNGHTPDGGTPSKSQGFPLDDDPTETENFQVNVG